MGTWIVAGVTFKEAARKKILWIALLVGLAFLALFGLAQYFQVKDFRPDTPILVRRQEWNAELMVGLYAVNLLMVAITVLASVDTLSGEITSGTIQAVATKPIPRRAVLLGKWLGFVGMLALYLALMVGGITGVTYVLTGYAPPHMLRGVSLMGMELLLLLTLTFLFGTSFSTLTNGVLALGMHGLAFVGGWIEEFGTIAHSQRMVTLGIVSSVIMPSEALWRRAAFEMTSPLVRALSFSPFAAGSLPSLAMVAYAAIYLAMALGLALRQFARRDL